jgi:hypothetical protein
MDMLLILTDKGYIRPTKRTIYATYEFIWKSNAPFGEKMHEKCIQTVGWALVLWTILCGRACARRSQPAHYDHSVKTQKMGFQQWNQNMLVSAISPNDRYRAELIISRTRKRIDNDSQRNNAHDS